MILQDQVCTREQGKRPKELGIAPFSHFYHGLDTIHRLGSDDVPIPAFTVAELGILLHPNEYPVPGSGDWFTNPVMEYHKGKGDMTAQWEVYFRGTPWGIWTNEAEARAALLIHLLENNIITADEANKRLEQ